MSNPAMRGRTSTLSLADIRADLTGGKTLTDVAAAHGVAASTIRSRLTQAGYRYDGTPLTQPASRRIGSAREGQVGAYIGGGDRPVVTRPWGSFVRGGEVG